MSNEGDLPIRSQWNFRLVHLFFATALLASGLALSWQTLWFSLIILLGWAIVFSRPNRSEAKLWFCLVSFFLFMVLVGNPSWISSRQLGIGTARRISCLNNLRQIMLAVHNFEASNGFLPTDLIVTMPDGTRLRHSWRISILPYLEEEALYRAYDFDEPWNGPNNRKLAEKMPAIWRCPDDRSNHETTYQLVNGPGTAFEPGARRQMKHVSDGLSQTIALIENSVKPVHWMEPTDLSAETAATILNSKDPDSCPHVVNGLFDRRHFGPNIAMLDSGTHSLPSQTAPPIDKGVFLISDGIKFNSKSQTGCLIEIKYQAYLSMGLYVMLIALPGVFLFRTSE